VAGRSLRPAAGRLFLGVGERDAELVELDDEPEPELEPLVDELAELELLERERRLGFDSTIITLLCLKK